MLTFHFLLAQKPKILLIWSVISVNWFLVIFKMCSRAVPIFIHQLVWQVLGPLGSHLFFPYLRCLFGCLIMTNFFYLLLSPSFSLILAFFVTFFFFLLLFSVSLASFPSLTLPGTMKFEIRMGQLVRRARRESLSWRKLIGE